MWLQELRENTIYVPNQLIIETNSQAKDLLVSAGLPKGYPPDLLNPVASSPLYILNSPDDVQSFLSENEPLLSASEKFYSNQTIFDKISAPLQQSLKLSNYVLLLAGGGSILIIGLIILLSIRERKHELGILLSLGEAKSRVIQQMILEVMVIAIIGLLLSVFSGQIIANTLSDTLIEQELTTSIDFSEDEDFWATQNQMGQFTSYVDPTEVSRQYETTLTPEYVITFLGISLGTSILATALPALYIVNLKPKNILMG
ncbi:MAG TPA: FtsX-like permease family protein [Tissierellia bacterium]|nr:FtsX-like permease family protein [Tissierellia bacterium]